jgi:predicted RNA-binding protein with PUA-like domain
MAYWLFKEEPTHYSFDDLVRDGQTTWNGISNALALKHLRQVNKGDSIFYYHTGSEKAIVGVMTAAADAVEDPSTRDVSVAVAPGRRLARPVPLSEIKADPAFADWELTRISRLSIMPVSAARWKRVLALAKT